jgi:hypothetical protein
MVVNRAEDTSGFDGDHTHSKLAPSHALNLRTKVNRGKQFDRNTFGFMFQMFVAHRDLLSGSEGPNESS